MIKCKYCKYKETCHPMKNAYNCDEYKKEGTVEVKDVWFDNKGNPRMTIEYTKEESYDVDI